MVSTWRDDATRDAQRTMSILLRYNAQQSIKRRMYRENDENIDITDVITIALSVSRTEDAKIFLHISRSFYLYISVIPLCRTVNANIFQFDDSRSRDISFLALSLTFVSITMIMKIE